MDSYRIYGSSEVRMVLIHGGPGARGSLRDLAKTLSQHFSVVEIDQFSLTIDKLIEDMHNIIHKLCKRKIILLGHSWGAWLIALYADRHPEMVEQLILVGSGPFESRYLKEFHQKRLSRLSRSQKLEYDKLLTQLNSDSNQNRNSTMSKFGSLMERVDSYQYFDQTAKYIGEADFESFNAIWSEASKLRESGELIDTVKRIDIPINIVQGDHDSHGINGILEPFRSHQIKSNNFTIERCGHYPWRERYGRERFLNIILDIVNSIDEAPLTIKSNE